MAEPAVPGSRGSLAARVALAVAGVLLIGGVLVSLAAFAYGKQAAREAYDRLLVGAATDIASAISIVEGAAVVDLPVSAFELLALAPDDRIRYRVIGPDGATLTGYEDAPTPPVSTGRDVVFYDDALGQGRGRYVAVTRDFAERDFSGPVRVIVGQTGLARRAFAFSITRNALIVLALTGLAMTALATLALRAALRPLGRIGAVLARRDPHDLTPLDLAVPREAEAMVLALNSFMGRLERQVTSMRTLIEDSAHQLRTPVAAIRAQADLAAGEADPARQAGIVRKIHRRAVSLGRLLDQMLSRAMVLHRSESVPPEQVDLRDVALEVLESCEADSPPGAARISLSLPPEPVTMLGDPVSLGEAWKNLLNNALRHGLPPVSLGVDRQAGSVRLWVSDGGDGPPPEVRAQLGRRFARSASPVPGSAGLGLSISHAVAEAHGGTLQLGAQAGRFRAMLVLPGRGPAA